MRTELPAQSRFGAGLAAINFAILFNIPFAVLGANYEYPQILRHPAGEALDKFAAGGMSLILTWYVFGFTALLLTPLSVALSITPRRHAVIAGLGDWRRAGRHRRQHHPWPSGCSAGSSWCRRWPPPTRRTRLRPRPVSRC